MARTFISQPTQIFHSETYNDALATGPALQVSSSNLETDLNALRTQVRQLLWANVAGNWYDAVTAPSGGLSARGLNTINVDLTDLEQKRFLFRRQNLNLVNVATGSNFAQLSASLGTTPADFAVVNASLNSGTIVAYLSGTEGSYGTHSMAQVSGATVLTPKNLVLVRDAFTHHTLTASMQQEIFGLLQVESGTLSGDSFNDSNHRTQISFVYEVTVNGTSSLQPASMADIGGKTVQYSYVRRVALDDIPEDAYLSNNIFIDVPTIGSTGLAQFSDITLQNAIDNQVGTVTQNKNIDIALNSGFHWAYLSGTKELWKLTSGNEDLLTVAVDRIALSSTFPTTFQKGISVSTGSSQIDLGILAGVINTLTGTQLVLSGGSTLGFSDNFGPNSTYTGGIIPFATASIEWNNFASDWGNQTSLLGALHRISQSLSSSASTRVRLSAGVTTTVSPDTNITFPTNLDATLPSYAGKNFVSEVNVYLNGVLCLPSLTGSDPNDVYPGTAAASGDLKFPFTVRSGTILSLEVF